MECAVQGLQRKLKDALVGQDQAAEVQQGFQKLQTKHTAAVAALATLEAAHAKAERRHSEKITALEAQLHAVRAEAADVSATRAARLGDAAGTAGSASTETAAESLRTVAGLERDLEDALRVKAALQLAKNGAETELASVKQQLASLQKQKQGELTVISPAANAAGLGIEMMPELAAAQAAAAEAAQQVGVLEQKLASAQVRLLYQSLFRPHPLSAPVLKAYWVQSLPQISLLRH